MIDFLKFSKSKDWALLRSSYVQEVEELMPYFNTAVDEMENSSVMLIPLDYRYSLALKIMLSHVRNLRASNWKECADLYEEQLHRWTMESNSAEALQIQQEISSYTRATAKSAKAAAIFSGLNFFLK